MSDIPNAIEVVSVPEVPKPKRPAKFCRGWWSWREKDRFREGRWSFHVMDTHADSESEAAYGLKSGESLFRIPAEGEAAEAPAGWILAAERMPDVNAIVLFYMPMVVSETGMIRKGVFDGKMWDDAELTMLITRHEVSHWMPLPEPPT